MVNTFSEVFNLYHWAYSFDSDAGFRNEKFLTPYFNKSALTPELSKFLTFEDRLNKGRECFMFESLEVVTMFKKWWPFPASNTETKIKKKRRRKFKKPDEDGEDKGWALKILGLPHQKLFHNSKLKSCPWLFYSTIVGTGTTSLSFEKVGYEQRVFLEALSSDSRTLLSNSVMYFTSDQ